MKHSSSFLHHRSIWAIGDLARRDIAAILDTARSLKRAAAAGLPLAPLRGKNVAVVGASAGPTGRDSLEQAACELGARVTHLQSTGSASNGAAAATYRMLGRLYDAIDCVDMPPDEVRRIEHEAGVPVFDGLSSVEHPARVIGELMEMEEYAHRPLQGLRVGFGGPIDTPRAQALARLAERTGVQMEAGAERDFFIDGAAKGRWQCRTAGGAVDEGASEDDHRYVVQALLVMALG